MRAANDIYLYMRYYSYIVASVSMRVNALQGLRVIEKFTKNKDFRAQIAPYWDFFVPTPSRKNHAFFTIVNKLFSRFQRCR